MSMSAITLAPFKIESLRTQGLVLTFKGLTLLAFILLLYLGPVSESADIVSTVIVLSLFALIFVVLGINLIYFLRLRKAFTQEFDLGATNLTLADSYHPYKPVRLLLRLPQHNLPPFFYLSLQIYFEKGGIQTVIHKILGTDQTHTLIHEDLIFPHRGYWRTGKLLLSLQDSLGVSNTTWSVRQALQIKIVPERHTFSDLPVLSSCNRPGDKVPETSERLGDYYDLKPYHPSDGMRKIIWKIFAKTGTLVSRHPEKAMNPEGQLLLFCLAKKNDDHVCAAALGYADMLEEIGIELLAGCESMSNDALAKTSEQLEELLTSSVWQTESSNETSLSKDLSGFLALANSELAGNRVERAVVFASRQRVNTAAGFAEIVKVGDNLESLGISPFFILISPLAPASKAKALRTSGVFNRFSKLKNWLFEPAGAAPSTTTALGAEFDAICLKHNWSVIIK